MTSSLSKYVFLFFILIGFPQTLTASSPQKLIIKPSVCMVKTLGDTCRMTVKVMWQHDQYIDACLYQNESQLTCWKNVKAIDKNIDINLAQDMAFTLKNEQQVFAFQEIKINTVYSKKYRRRLRANWSFF